MRNLGKNVVVVAALVAAGFFAAWLRFRPYLGDAGKYSDGQRTYASTGAEGIRYAVWDAPEPLAGVNGPGTESAPAVSPDGRLLVFAVGEVGLNQELWVAELGEGGPGPPRPLAELNTAADEGAPAFGRDGLYFASNRGGGAGGLDLYRAGYADGRFEAPQSLGSVNTRADETDPAPGPGSLLAFASDRGSVLRRDHDLFLARPSVRDARAWDVRPLEELNTRAEEREPRFSSDGRALFFASDRGREGFDLWRAVRGSEGAGEDWLAPRPLAGVNGPGAQRAPAPSDDGFALLFAAPGADGDLDLWRARSLELYRLPGRPVGWVELLVLCSLLLLALLAYLAKHWEALDVLYKCFLVSVVAHLLLLYAFRDVYPEGGEVELAGGDTLFQVRLAPSAGGLAVRNRERAGALEVTRSERAEAQRPERAEAREVAQETPEPFAASAPELPAPALGDAPERGAAEVAPTLADAGSRAPELRDAAEDLERRAGAAPELALAVATRGVERADGVPATPSRASAAGSVPEVGEPRPEPRAPAIARREAAAPERGDVGSTLDVAAGERALERVAGVGLAEPSEAPARRSGAAPTFDLAARALEAERSATVARPERAGGLEGVAAARATPLADPAPPAPAVATPAPSDDAAAPARGTLVADLAPAPRARPSTELRDAPPPARAEPTRPARATAPPALDLAGLVPTAEAARPERASRPAGPTRAQPAPPVSAVVADARPMPAPVLSERAPSGVEGPARRGDGAWEKTPYRLREGLEKELALERHGGSAETERAVANGLAYLARIQRPEGYWGSPGDYHEKYGHVIVGKTGLALLAFLGAGHTPDSGTQHADVARRAVEFLLANQDPRSGHFGDTSSYSHGIATYALAECHAMTGDRALREPLERAVRHIRDAQHRTRDERLGGWGYYYMTDRQFDRWPRVSVTAWQVMALESARLGGLQVPDVHFERARTFLLGSWDERRGWYRYSHDPDRLRSGYPTLPASTPAALFVLSLLGEDLADARYAAARDFVMRRAPERYARPSDDDFVFEAAGNLYFWYYATLATFRCGGALWEAWNARMKEVLLPAQSADGSWEPISLYAGYAGDDAGDKSYTTAMCVLTLEIYYRYFTPLLEVR